MLLPSDEDQSLFFSYKLTLRLSDNQPLGRLKCLSPTASDEVFAARSLDGRRAWPQTEKY
jgi:hypothetical protein